MKKRRYRKRLRDGVCVLRVEIKEAEFAEALLLSKRLTDRAALRREQLSREAESILAEFAQRWRKMGPPSQM